MKKTNGRKSSAPAERRAAGKKLREIMTPGVEVVRPNDTLQIAARKMQQRDIGFLPVCDGEKLVGTLSDRDIAVRAVAAGFDPRTAPVRDFVTPHVIWCFDDEDVDEAAQKMQEKQIRRLMVLNRDSRRLVGVVSLGDLAANGTAKLSGEVLQSVSSTAA